MLNNCAFHTKPRSLWLHAYQGALETKLYAMLIKNTLSVSVTQFPLESVVNKLRCFRCVHLFLYKVNLKLLFICFEISPTSVFSHIHKGLTSLIRLVLRFLCTGKSLTDKTLSNGAEM